MNHIAFVATVLTVYGIETSITAYHSVPSNYTVATVLTACGIETIRMTHVDRNKFDVATVPTVYGIETLLFLLLLASLTQFCCNSTYRLRY